MTYPLWYIPIKFHLSGEGTSNTTKVYPATTIKRPWYRHIAIRVQL